MALTVRFIDTSVLCNLVDVPGRNQDRDRIREEFAALLEEGLTVRHTRDEHR